MARDQDGTVYDMEVQRGGHAQPWRSRYYGSVMDVDELVARDSFDKLPDRWVIFVVESDPMGRGLPAYAYEYRDRTGEFLEDGSHILYANGDWDGDDALGRLMRDFKRANPADMETPELRERVHYLKETEQGRQEVSNYDQELFEEGRAEGRASTMIEFVRSLMETTSCTVEHALDTLRVPEAERPAVVKALGEA